MTPTVFAFIGAVGGLGFVGNYLFKKTGVPDVLILVFLGILLGPVLHVVGPSGLAPLAPLFSALALVVIMFEGSLHLSLHKVLEESPKAFLLAVVGTALSVAVTAGAAVFLLEWTVMEGLLLGAILGGSSSALVITLVSRSKAHERVITLLTLESAFTDAIVIVLAISLLQIVTTKTVENPLSSALRSLAGGLSTGVVLGVICGVSWARLLGYLDGHKYLDMLTLCTVLCVYAMVESIGGSGAIAVLVFGMSIANGRDILAMLRRPPLRNGDNIPVHFVSEIAFLVRTFFFVYLGFITMVTGYLPVIAGVSVAVLLFVARWVAAKLIAVRDTALKNNVSVVTFILPRGLAAAVLAQMAADAGIAIGSVLVGVVTVTIIATVLIGAAGGFYLTWRGSEDILEAPTDGKADSVEMSA